MTQSLDIQAKKVFDKAIELQGAARDELLNRMCADDAELRARVVALLAAAEKEDVFLSEPTLGATQPTRFTQGIEEPGAMIGPYKLVKLIGEGGFGLVFMAEQSAPVRRYVALKIIKMGMDTRSVIARFEQERQALALMDHANIARVFDGGATQTGRPYFVMELVKGQPITQYCDGHCLNIEERLELFAQVCRAVQHAHNRGVIHRDIKPANVLVDTQDDKPICKVIDFGIAKAIERRIAEKTVFTEYQQLIGTPEYMSPEQAEGNLDIDTRTDVYSLGVLLYELLAGMTPFDGTQLRRAAYGEMQRIIKEVDPPTPSTRLSESRATLQQVAGARRTLPHKLTATLRGELDWIVMRAIEKDRARRYESPGNCAADVERFLAGETVFAAPPSAAYRLTKFIRRHRLGVTTSAMVAVSLILGMGTAVWQARVAAHERDLARHSASEALAAKADAESHRKETEEVAEFQAAQLKGIDVQAMGKKLKDDLLNDAKSGMQQTGLPTEQISDRQAQLSRLLTDVNPTNVALEILDENIFSRALTAVREQFKNQPLVKARLFVSLGETLTELGLLDRAQTPLEEGVAIRRSELGDDHPDTLAALDSLGILRYSQGRLPEAETVFRECQSGRRRVLGTTNRLTIESISNLGSVLEFQGKRSEAIPFYEESLELARRNLGEDDPATLLQMNNVGHLLHQQGKLPEAERLMREALEHMRRTLKDDHPSTLFAIMNLGIILEDEGRFSEAEPLLREAVERRRRVLGENHQDTLRALMALGTILRECRRFAEAEPYYREVLERRRAVLGADHPDTLEALNNMGALLESEGNGPDAEPYFREALDRRRRVLGESHPGTLWSEYMLGRSFISQKKFSEAEPLLRNSVRGLEAKFGKSHDRVADCKAGMGMALTGLGRFVEAEEVLIDAENVLRSAAGADSRRRLECVDAIIHLYEEWEKTEPGKGHLRQAEKWRAKATSQPATSEPTSQAKPRE